MNSSILKQTAIESLIHEIRGMKVMLDFDLAELYQVETRALNQAVKRNAERFPKDFMFQLNEHEWYQMSSQIVTTSIRKRPKSALPFAFTDLSEDMRREIDTIYQAIAALSVKEPTQKKPQRQKIGFKTQNNK